MARTAILPAVIVSLLASGVLAGPAGAASGNARATQAYLNANYALVKAAQAKQSIARAALKTLLGGVQSGCPNAAVDSPQNTDSEQLSNEMVGAMIVVGTQPDRQPISRFATAVSGLHWSSGKLTSTIRSYASQLKTLSTLAAPDLCTDVRTWVGGAYQTLPASTTAFNLRYKAVNVPIGELPEALLAPYLNPGQASLLSRTRQLEAKVATFEAEAVEVYAAIMNTLVLQP